MAVALIALFVAMGGVGYAATRIGSKQIKNNSIRGKDIRNRTIATKDVKKNLFQRTSGLLFATVAPGSSNPRIVRGRGAVSVTRASSSGGTERYIVTFRRSVSNCTWLATYGRPDSSSSASSDARFISVRGGGSTRSVEVRIFDPSGSSSDSDGFHLGVLCP